MSLQPVTWKCQPPRELRTRGVSGARPQEHLTPEDPRWRWGAVQAQPTRAGRSDCTDTTRKRPPADAHRDPVGEWPVTIKLHLVAGLTVASESVYLSYTPASGGI